MDTFEKYVAWVKENYTPLHLSPNDVTVFQSEREHGSLLSLEERAYLYVKKGFPLMLEGGTGTGKTTLVQNIAVRLNLPLCKQIGYDRFSLDAALINRTMVDSNVHHQPGQLSRALIFEGIYFLEEAANISPRDMVDFHSVLQGQDVDIPTHFGNVQVNVRDIKNFRFIGAGNFSYHRPNFTPATLQRFVWMNLHYLSDESFMHLLKSGESSTFSDGKLEGMEKKFKELFTDQEITESYIDELSILHNTIRKKLNESELGKMRELDQNPACYLRAFECYSPALTENDYFNIFRETVLYPIAGKHWFRAREHDEHKRISELEELTRKEIDKHANLFSTRRKPLKALRK